MMTDVRKSFAAFVFVACVSAPSLGSAPHHEEEQVSRFCAQMGQLISAPRSDNLQFDHLTLVPTGSGSYGWTGGQLRHAKLGLCLAKVQDTAGGVAFRACDSADSGQFWQWKRLLGSAALQGVEAVSVFQHPMTGSVLDRARDEASRFDSLTVNDYQVGSDSQRFAIGVCSD